MQALEAEISVRERFPLFEDLENRFKGVESGVLSPRSHSTRNTRHPRQGLLLPHRPHWRLLSTIQNPH